MAGKLVKACFVKYRSSGNSHSVDKKYYVQFNPSQYSVSRSVSQTSTQGIGQDAAAGANQVSSAMQTKMTVSIYFDTYNELKQEIGAVNFEHSESLSLDPQMPSINYNQSTEPKAHTNVLEQIKNFLGLIKYVPEEHEPPRVGFIWGQKVFFVGTVSEMDVEYTMFERDGTPVRAKINITMMGEDIYFDNRQRQYPMESPDRTKQRNLLHGDQLWLLAQEEFGDVNRWKDIATANGIINPRKNRGAKELTVPAIR